MINKIPLNTNFTDLKNKYLTDNTNNIINNNSFDSEFCQSFVYELDLSINQIHDLDENKLKQIILLNKKKYNQFLNNETLNSICNFWESIHPIYNFMIENKDSYSVFSPQENKEKINSLWIINNIKEL